MGRAVACIPAGSLFDSCAGFAVGWAGGCGQSNAVAGRLFTRAGVFKATGSAGVKGSFSCLVLAVESVLLFGPLLWWRLWLRILPEEVCDLTGCP